VRKLTIIVSLVVLALALAGCGQVPNVQESRIGLSVPPANEYPSFEQEVTQEALEAPPPTPEPEVATNRERLIVERIIDGDTIVARDASGNRFRIRLIGIDAPEANESGGTSATNYLAGMISSGSEVWAEICPVRLVDRFDRERAYLWTSPTSNSDNDFIQTRMLQSGNARVSIVTPCCGYHTSRLR